MGGMHKGGAEEGCPGQEKGTRSVGHQESPKRLQKVGWSNRLVWLQVHEGASRGGRLGFQGGEGTSAEMALLEPE